MIGLGTGLWVAARQRPRAGNLWVNSRRLGAVSGSPGTTPTGHSTILTTGGTLAVGSSPYGGNSLRRSATAGRLVYAQSITADAGTAYCFSDILDVTVAQALNQTAILNILPAGTTSTYRVNGVVGAALDLLPVGTGVLFELVITTAATGGTLQIREGIFCASGTGAADVTSYAPMLEAGAARSVYLPT